MRREYYLAHREEILQKNREYPLSRGGTHEYSNLAVTHLECNFQKNNKTFQEWKEYVRY